MATRYNEIEKKHQVFIDTQKIFFVATATTDGHINLSPKGMDSFRIINKNRIMWLNVTGSGNETAAHLQENSRMTMMWTAFQDTPLILRLYGQAKTILPTDKDWQENYAKFKPNPGARQIFDVKIDLVQTSCGMATPFFDYVGEREQLNNWANQKGDQGIKDYWQEKNTLSLDNKEIKI